MVSELENDLAIIFLETAAPVENRPISVGPFTVIQEGSDYSGYIGGYGKKSVSDRKMGYFRKSKTEFQIVNFNQQKFLVSQGKSEGYSGDSGSGLFYFQAVSDDPSEDVVVLVGILSTVFARNSSVESTYEYLKSYNQWVSSEIRKKNLKNTSQVTDDSVIKENL
jgi:hypothetical protein